MMTREFWGKVDLQNNAWHPAIYHMIDCGMVAKELLLVLPSQMTKVLTNVLTKEQLAYYASLHDLGKITPGFNYKIIESKDLNVVERFGFLNKLGSIVAECQNPQCSKNCCFKKCVSKKYLGLSKEDKIHNFGTAKILKEEGDISKILGAHHGTFVTQNNINSCGIGCENWRKVQQQAILELRQVFGPQPLEKKNLGNDFVLMFAAFVSICDWISSNKDYFKCVNVGDNQSFTINKYAEHSYTLAHDAVTALNWNFKNHTERHEFEKLFCNDKGVELTPYPWQKELIKKLSKQTKPFLLLIEAPTGCGKSESALIASDIAEANLGYHGSFFALPTQAASNQMFTRFHKYLEKRPYDSNYKPEFHLRHHLAYMNKEYKEIQDNTKHDPDSLKVSAIDWFANSKQGLLPPYAVGTIDQIIMSGLMVRHNFVRMFGLLNKIIILDEVHSYDMYASNILTRIIEWLSYLGSSIVVLSATLPKQKRNELMKAYCKKPVNVDVKYPLFAIANEDEVTATHIDVQDYQPVQIEFINEGDLFKKVQEQLLKNVNVAIVRNIVSEAQNTYRHLSDVVLDHNLFHARFPSEVRLEIEHRITEKYKYSGNRPDKSILVATDVIGQSVDLDFDIMFTDVAPIDIVLQRMGRLWRHQRKRSVEKPMLYIIKPGEGYEFGTSEIIYSPYILRNTMKILENRGSIDKIKDVEFLVDSVYSGKIQSLLCDKEYNDNYTKYMEKLSQSKMLASEYKVPSPINQELIMCLSDYFDTDNCELSFPSTRETIPSIPIICVDDQIGNFIYIGKFKIDIDKKPTYDDKKLLLARSVNIMIYPWVTFFADKDKCHGWEDTVLDRYRVAVFNKKDSSGRRFIQDSKGRVLSLDNEYGLETYSV